MTLVVGCDFRLNGGPTWSLKRLEPAARPARHESWYLFDMRDFFGKRTGLKVGNGRRQHAQDGERIVSHDSMAKRSNRGLAADRRPRCLPSDPDSRIRRPLEADTLRGELLMPFLARPETDDFYRNRWQALTFCSREQPVR